MANPTTNYGFVLPTSTDLVTDLPADFDVALQGVDTRLKALQPGTTLGDIAYSSATANTNTRLAIGSTGNVLTVSGGVPAWAAPAGGGKVLQVVFASSNTSTTVASTTYTDSTLSATITPTSATSTILIIYNQAMQSYRANVRNGGGIRLLRGATSIQDLLEIADNTIGGATSVSTIGTYGATYRDSPATTSSTTYKTQVRAADTANGGLVAAQANSTVSTITLIEIGA